MTARIICSFNRYTTSNIQLFIFFFYADLNIINSLKVIYAELFTLKII